MYYTFFFLFSGSWSGLVFDVVQQSPMRLVHFGTQAQRSLLEIFLCNGVKVEERIASRRVDSWVYWGIMG